VNLANAYIALKGNSSPSNYQQYNNWDSNQKVVFHQQLYWGFANAAVQARIDGDLNVSATSDPEIKQRWFAIGISNNYGPIWTPCEQWVSSMGRDKYLYTIYNECAEAGSAQLQICRTWATNNKWFYTPGTNYMVKQILGM
jgi:hypothetical protein